MTTEESRQTVLTFCRHLSNRDFERMKAMTTGDATWFVVGRPDRVKNGGTHTFDEIRPTLEAFLNGLDSFEFEVVGTTAEGGRVAIEAVSRGKVAETAYENQYLMQYEIADGRVKSVREFFDQSSVDAFNDLMTPSSRAPG